MQNLMKAKFNAVGILRNHQEYLDSLPEEYHEFCVLCSEIKGLGNERNRTIHDVYRCWIGKHGVTIDRVSLRKGYENLLALQPGARAEVTSGGIDELTTRIFEKSRDLRRLVKALLGTN